MPLDRDAFPDRLPAIGATLDQVFLDDVERAPEIAPRGGRKLHTAVRMLQDHLRITHLLTPTRQQHLIGLQRARHGLAVVVELGLIAQLQRRTGQRLLFVPIQGNALELLACRLKAVEVGQHTHGALCDVAQNAFRIALVQDGHARGLVAAHEPVRTQELEPAGEQVVGA